jgi:obg-like ATPase 1
MEIIIGELIAKDKQHCEREIEECERVIKRHNDKQAKVELAVLQKAMEGFNENRMIKDGTWSNAEVEILNKWLFLTSKPIIYLINMSERDYIRKKNKWLAKIAKFVTEHGGGPMIPFSVELEQTLFHMEPEQRAEHLA